MIVVTGATGNLGRLVIEELIKSIPASQIVAAVRNPAKAKDLAALGVVVKKADYENAEDWDSALAGVQKVLLISSSEIGKRAQQHSTVVNAAKKAGVKLFAYTSILRADTSSLSLASEHQDTEEQIRKSGIPFVFLRNGWYLENHTENLGAALEHGVILGAAGNGRFSSASRSDYAAAAAAVLINEGHENKVYELAGDNAFTLSELAAEVGRRSKREVKYQDMPVSDYEKALLGFGLPGPIASMLADSDRGAAKGELYSDSKDLSNLIKRPTVTLSAAVAQAVKA